MKTLLLSFVLVLVMACPASAAWADPGQTFCANGVCARVASAPIRFVSAVRPVRRLVAIQPVRRMVAAQPIRKGLRFARGVLTAPFCW
jgi:hypothetical protein